MDDEVPVNKPPEPMTREQLEETLSLILKEYKNGMTVYPEWFIHVSPCCYRTYETMGPCAEECPYCGEKNTRKYCASCDVIKKDLDTLFNGKSDDE